MATCTLPADSSPLARLALRDDVYSAVIAFSLAALGAVVCMAICEEAHHTLVLPVILCGGLIGMDAVDWFRGRVDTFDPIGMLGLMGVHFFYFAPLLHVLSGWYMFFVVPPDDWRPWLEAMAWINVAGLVMYRMGRGALTAAWPPTPTKTVWTLEPRRFTIVCGLMMATSVVLQALVYLHFGGIAGFVQQYTAENFEGFHGFGHVFMVSEALPILAVIAYAVWSKGDSRRRTWPGLLAVLVGFVALKFLFGGLKGNRGHLIYGMFWALGIIHLLIRPFTKKQLIAGGLAGLAFMYVYGFYKNYGVEAVAAIRGQEVTRELGEEMNRSPSYVLLGDLAQSDVQAFLLYRLSPECRALDFKPVWGESYVGALALLVPKFVVPDRPPIKTKAGTDALFGYGVYQSELVATNAYGLAGEAMLNFGIIGAPLSFLALAGVLVWTRRWAARLDPSDMRQLLVPFAYSLVFMTLIWDSDVLIVYALKEMLVPALVIWTGSQHIPRNTTILEESAT